MNSLLVFLPNGKTQSYPNVSGVKADNGLTSFIYAQDDGQKKRVYTTLPILVEQKASTPSVTVLD